jgi:hypothetical protein
MPFEEFIQLCTSLGYSPTQAGRLGMMDPGEESDVGADTLEEENE